MTEDLQSRLAKRCAALNAEIAAKSEQIRELKKAVNSVDDSDKPEDAAVTALSQLLPANGPDAPRSCVTCGRYPPSPYYARDERLYFGAWGPADDKKYPAEYLDLSRCCRCARSHLHRQGKPHSLVGCSLCPGGEDAARAMEERNGWSRDFEVR